MELKLIKKSKEHTNLTHCAGCGFYGENNFYEKPEEKDVCIRFFVERLVLCDNCKLKIEKGYVIVAKKGGYGGHYLKKIKEEKTNC